MKMNFIFTNFTEIYEKFSQNDKICYHIQNKTNKIYVYK